MKPGAITSQPRKLWWLGMIILLTLLIGGCQQERTGGPLMAGDAAPDFAARDLEGDVLVLSNLTGKPILLRFYETNCRYCRADTPIIKSYLDRYRDYGFEVIYVSSFYEDLPAVKDFIKELEVNFPVIMDNDAKLADLYNVKVYPQTFVISPERQILANIFGGVGEAELDELIGKYLVGN